MKSSLKWKRATPIYPTDHIISSKAREVNALYGFKPEYETEKRPHIRFLLSNEYMRLWFRERVLYQKENYSKQEKTKSDGKLQRGYVQWNMANTRSKCRELPKIQLKRFQNAISKIDTRRTVEEKTKICERYKKTIAPVIQVQRYKPACAGVTSKQKSTTGTPQKTQKKGVKEPESPSKQDPLVDDTNDCAFVCKLIN
ncbi:hypothetical protein Zmor_006890 [Zophobas morio]|uniref:Uncharacterized protein n=1 Tax=Zophobas morio TaxID=2755281 RepID=A0AA38IXZ1_9CUCU|nr:hypothetical protein Zmor_006890 [Zophobas morio]